MNQWLISIFFLAVVQASSGQFFSEAKPHPKCIKVTPTHKLSSEWGMALLAGSTFYIPLGQTQAIEHISDLLSPGARLRNKTTSGGPPKLCAQVLIKGFKLRMDGFGDHFLIQDCSVIKKGVNHCVVNSLSESTKRQAAGDGMFTIVWTDNKSTMVIVRCTSDGLHNDWFVLSTGTTITPTVKWTILTNMLKFGFANATSEAQLPSYEGCVLLKED